jgi:hypothetical protein
MATGQKKWSKTFNIGHQIIHEHEELAEKLALVLYLLGISIGGIF